jgi:hypothetical protein
MFASIQDTRANVFDLISGTARIVSVVGKVAAIFEDREKSLVQKKKEEKKRHKRFQKFKGEDLGLEKLQSTEVL